MPEPMRFAVVGCGMLARQQHIPNIAASQRMTLHTCCDLSDKALSECREKFGALHTVKDYRDVVRSDEVEAIVLATTHDLRLPVIEAAAQAGKPVYVEKPLANTIEEMREIEKIVKDAGIPFCIGHNRRSAPAMLEAHAIFRAHMTDPAPCPWRFDREGDNRPRLPDDGLATMSVRINDDWYSWKLWVMDENYRETGPMLWEMTHFTDLCNWFLAAEPDEVCALDSGYMGCGVTVRYRTGEIATILMTANGTFGYMKELYEVFGNGAAVVVDHMLEIRTAGIEGQPHRKTYPLLNDCMPDTGAQGGVEGYLEKKRAACRLATQKGDPTLGFPAEPDKGHARALERFVEEIRGRGPVVCGIDDTLAASRVALAAIRSAHERRMVKIEEI